MAVHFHERAGFNWAPIKRILAFIATGLAVIAGLAQIALTRSDADKIYETKERAEIMYQHFEESHQAALDEIKSQIEDLNQNLEDMKNAKRH